jgi:hypothetical protein
MGSCSRVPSRHALNAAASGDPGIGSAYSLSKAPGQNDWTPGPVLGREERWNGQIGGEILHVHNYRKEEK